MSELKKGVVANKVNRGAAERIKEQHSRHYASLEKLARQIAVNEDLHEELLMAMKHSKVKENIVNFTQSLKNDNSYAFKNERANKAAHKLRGNIDLDLNFIEQINHDINIYFPVKKHREAVLENGESFYVVFNPPHAQYEGKYELWGYSLNNKKKKFRSDIVPDDANVMVLAYSENQELFSYLPCFERDPCSDPSPELPPNPDPIEPVYDGLKLTRFKTKDIHDGWLDGDLEILIELTQSILDVQAEFLGFEANIGTETFKFMNVGFEHDAGYWWVFGFTNSNKWTNIDKVRRLQERQKLINNTLGVTVLNPKFRLQITEIDPIWDEKLVDHHFYVDEYLYGTTKQFGAIEGGGTVYLQIDRGNYTVNQFNY